MLATVKLKSTDPAPSRTFRGIPFAVTREGVEREVTEEQIAVLRRRCSVTVKKEKAEKEGNANG